jgi:hypothetical protein
MSDKDSMLILIYFAFTSLTTVGFGDFNPRSDAERLFTAFGLLIGVSLFSYIMSEFINMIEKFNDITCEDEGDLNKFFGLLKEFNNDEHINMELKRKIEQYFNHRWDEDRTCLFEFEIDSSDFMNQLP